MAFIIGRYIQDARKRHHVSAADLAKTLKIPDSVLTKWELDNSFPGIDAVNALAEAIGCDVRELFGMKPLGSEKWRHPFAKKDTAYWKPQGNVRRQQALGLIVQMAHDLTPADAPLREALDAYYGQLMTKRGTTVDFIIDTQNGQLAAAVGRNGLTWQPANKARYDQLVKLSRERFGI